MSRSYQQKLDDILGVKPEEIKQEENQDLQYELSLDNVVSQFSDSKTKLRDAAEALCDSFIATESPITTLSHIASANNINPTDLFNTFEEQVGDLFTMHQAITENHSNNQKIIESNQLLAIQVQTLKILAGISVDNEIKSDLSLQKIGKRNI